MKLKHLIPLFLALATPLARAVVSNQSSTGWCEVGDTKTKTSGSSSSNTFQASYPKCVVTVYLTGTTIKATLFSDQIPTPLANPFTAAQNGSYTFYAADGNYDIVLSGGLNPNPSGGTGFPTPVTIPNVRLGGGGGGGTPTVVAVNGTPISPASPANFVDTASVTWLNTGGTIQATAVGGGSGCTNSATAAGYGLLSNGLGGCIPADGSNTTPITFLDNGGGGIQLNESGLGGLALLAGPGGFDLSGGAPGIQDIVAGYALSIGSEGFVSPRDDLKLQAQTNHLELHSGTTSNTGYTSLDLSNFISGDAYTLTVPRFTGTWMLYNGTLTPNDCAMVNATGNGFVDSGAPCGSGGGGGSAFSALTSGSNTTANMVVGSGATLGTAGTGTLAATSVGGITVTGTPSATQVLTATSPTAASWSAAPGGSFSTLTGGTNTAAAMLVGTGASLAPTGSGSILASAAATAGTDCPVGQYSTGVDASFNAICTSLPTQPSSQYIAPQAISGCGVDYVSGLTYTIGACVYSINGVTYSSALSNITLSAADPTNPRIDAIFVDTTQVVQKITGTPAATPQQPTVDPSAQLQLTFVLVPAAGSTPADVTKVIIYNEGTEWSPTRGGTNATRINLTSTNNPYSGTRDTEFGNGGTVAQTGFAQYTDPAAGTVDMGNYNNLNFYIRNKAAWPATDSVSIQWFNGTTAKGIPVVLSSGAFGFNSTTNTTTYQQISIPTSTFGVTGIPVTSLRFTVSGTGAALTGFYLDLVTLQGGSGGGTPLPTTLMNFKGTWSSIAAYNPNDTVVSGGIGYVALLASTNVAVTTGTTWTPLGQTGGGGGTGTVTSVGLTAPAWLTVGGSPITTSGSFALSSTSQAQNFFLASPSGTSGAMTPRLIAPADLPLATGSAFGAIKPDGTTCSTSAGVLTCGGGIVNGGLTNGFFTKATSSNSIANAPIDDSVTTANTITASKKFAINATGTPTQIDLTPSGTSPATVAGAASLGVPNTVTSAGVYLLPASPATGLWHAVNASGIVTNTLSAVDLASADVTGNLGISHFNSGTSASSSTFWRGDGTWVPIVGGVSSFSGDGTLISNSLSTGAITATLATAAAHRFFGNNTGSTAAPAYVALTTGDLPTGIPNANLANAATTVNGQTCTLGSTCTVTAVATAMPFSGLSSATNTTAAMVVGTGSTLAATGSGTIAATSVTGNVNGAAVPTSAAFVGTNGSNQFISASLPIYLNWVFNSGAAATDASPRFLVSRTGTISSCYVLTTASDGSTALTFDIFKNGTTIYSAPQTIAAGTAAGTLTTTTPTTLSFTSNDKISINITSGTSSWIFSIQCK